MIFSKESSSSESFQEMMESIKQIGMLVLGSLLGDLVARFFFFCEYCLSNASKSWRKCFGKTLLIYDRVGEEARRGLFKIENNNFFFL